MKSEAILTHVSAIFKREIKAYFGSPVAYVFIAVFLLLMGFFTFHISHFFEMGQADLRAFFEWHPWLYLFLVPAAAMRLWAEELRMGTIELVLTFPITTGEVIIGKFLAAWAFIGIALALTFPMVLTVTYLGDPDPGPIITGYIGSFLMAGAFLGVGSMTSAVTRSQVISFILAVLICLFFILAGFPPVTAMMADWAPRWLTAVVSGLGFLSHFVSMQRGVLDLRDILYFGSVICFTLFANGIILQYKRA
ncbi:ABC transporter permease [Desulfococcus multivorans]|jgi:ABC-2 type transport system permease protein|uniref:ABC transporter permease n=1 Tax=Desulfococcus multivorans DSM 2059 TaxID=1121405 RepID=S7U6A1_DESML|nr:ABC transporter permease [Desulfococcus multivorans]AOY60235.1 putative ABC transporter, permease protein [Desulfococcus multivorans]AQV02349.1 ABC transporter permease [Desulfococcus multivorans]EPR44625.1 ABC transporter permease [Desulfococcus multivorans DSM 2059]MDX9820097.1 ABC transporter permease [Desulfococcus multivorans]SKA07338.1 ABC-2 type transport system permease protein [Desulfococcus multivorans DSM 2059]